MFHDFFLHAHQPNHLPVLWDVAKSVLEYYKIIFGLMEKYPTLSSFLSFETRSTEPKQMSLCQVGSASLQSFFLSMWLWASAHLLGAASFWCFQSFFPKIAQDTQNTMPSCLTALLTRIFLLMSQVHDIVHPAYFKKGLGLMKCCRICFFLPGKSIKNVTQSKTWEK